MNLNVLSLGAGVQSSTMALMAASGEITPMPDAAIFADTQAEPDGVYQWLKWLKPMLPFPVYQVSYGDLGKDGLELRRSQKSGKLYTRSLIPVFIKNQNGSRGIFPRKCTRDYKIAVIRREMKRLLGLSRVSSKSESLVTCWIGISLDEEERKKVPDVSWVTNRWPLIELGFTRKDCLEWMEAHGHPKPPRSACVFCPYHSDVEWLRLKNEEPEEFEKAVAWEKAYRGKIAQDETTNGEPFLHDSLVTLDKVKFNPKRGLAVVRECEGMCGV